MNSFDCVDFTAYQTLMEEVLVWLLAAEDHLDSATSIVTELQSVKDQFHKHEVNYFSKENISLSPLLFDKQITRSIFLNWLVLNEIILYISEEYFRDDCLTIR